MRLLRFFQFFPRLTSTSEACREANRTGEERWKLRRRGYGQRSARGRLEVRWRRQLRRGSSRGRELECRKLELETIRMARSNEDEKNNEDRNIVHREGQR